MNIRDGRTRLPVLAFPIAGLIATVAALVPGIGINPQTDPQGFARVADTIGLANAAGLVGFVLLLLGFQALYGFLAKASVERWALAGMYLSVAGAGLYASFLGILAFAAPIAGRMYLAGNIVAISIISEATSTSNPIALAFGGMAVLLYFLGSAFFSIAFWKSGKFPRWSAVAYVVAAPLNAIPHYIPLLWFFGGVLLLAAGIGIVMTIWKANDQA